MSSMVICFVGHSSSRTKSSGMRDETGVVQVRDVKFEGSVTRSDMPAATKALVVLAP